jgi:hypothetical protein
MLGRYAGAISVSFAIGIVAFVCADAALAQERPHGSVEVAVLGGLTLIMPSGGTVVTAVSAPTGAGLSPSTPSLRFTIWSESRMMFDAGFSFLHLENSGRSSTLGIIEGGIGMPLAKREATIQPFGTVVFGIVSMSSGASATEAYIGGVFGARTFIRDYAATRFQIGYRRTLGDQLDFGALEVAVGVSFFL